MIKKNLFIYFILQYNILVSGPLDLDTTFGTNNNGIVTTSIGIITDQANSTVIQADGKIVVVGYATIQNVNNGTLVRYNSDGSLDTSFGSNGIITTLTGSSLEWQSVTLQSDNKIVVTGFAIISGVTQIVVARYTTSGVLDSSFGSGGITTTTFGDGCSAYSIKMQSDGKIVIAGNTIVSGIIKFIVARYTSSGILDTGFNSTGIVTTLIDVNCRSNSLAIQTDGNIVVVGSSFDGTSYKFAIARYTTLGALDSTFGSGGIVTTAIGSVALANSVVIQTDGNILVAGYSNLSVNIDQFAIVRYTSTGSLDSSFGSGGIVNTLVKYSSRILDIKVQSDTKIVVGGYAISDQNLFAVARYSSGGVLDTTFGSASTGIITSLINSSATIQSLDIQTDGNIVATGFNISSSDIQQFTTVRYNSSNTNYINISVVTNASTITQNQTSFSGISSGSSATVKIYLDGVLFSTITTDGSGNWSTGLTSMLTDGLHTINARLMSGSTILSQDTHNFTIDTSIVRKFSAGAILRVDKQYGDDSTGGRNSGPFLTIGAALSVAQSGDLVWIFPGTYAETLTIPNGVSLFGLSPISCIVSKVVTTDTDLVTMGANSTIEGLTFSLVSANHVTLRGVVFPGTTSATSQIIKSIINVNNASASSGGTSNVYGIHSSGTGMPSNSATNTLACRIIVSSIGLGNKRGILIDAANGFNSRLTNIAVSGTGSGSFIGVETNNASASFTSSAALISGTTADISQTAGTITLFATALYNSLANSNAFNTLTLRNYMIFADSGSLALGATRYMRPGTGTSSTNEITITLPAPVLVKGMSVRAISAPGIGNTDTWTLRKNASDTGLSVSLSGTATTASSSSSSVSFAAGDTLSVKVVTALLTGTSDVVVVLDMY